MDWVNLLESTFNFRKTLEAIFAHPASGNIQWRDIEALFTELGADISQREGSRIAVVLFNEVR